MHRIDTLGNVDGKFTEGNPESGQISTRLGAAWLNDVQENIARVIAAADIELEKGNEDQLYLAIVQLAAGSVGEEGEEGSVPTTRVVDGAGLVKGGGALAADLELEVEAASSAEIIAGTVNDKAITPAGLLAAAGIVTGTAGYVRLPGGIIVQWGVGTALGNSTTVITLPTTFPNACAFAGVEGGLADTDASHNGPYVSGRGTGSISVFNAVNSSVGVNFVALGW